MNYDNFYKDKYCVIFYGRICHFKNNIKCYIFKNKQDMIKYCDKEKINLNQKKDYECDDFLLNEEEFPVLAGIKIKEIIIVSTKYEKYILKAYNMAKKHNSDVILKYYKDIKEE